MNKRQAMAACKAVLYPSVLAELEASRQRWVEAINTGDAVAARAAYQRGLLSYGYELVMLAQLVLTPPARKPRAKRQRPAKR